MQKNFISTTDKKTADILMKHGFQLMYGDNNSYIFLNNSKLLFELENEDLTIAYTDKLFM